MARWKYTKDERIRFWRGMSNHWKRKYFALLRKHSGPYTGTPYERRK